jgi:hypothetical protein
MQASAAKRRSVARRREFGHQGTHRAEARESMGLASLAEVGFAWVDVKVALRRLKKHPVLNLAAVFALAVGIPVGLAPSHVARSLEAPLPGDPEDRVRAIRYWDPLSSAVASTSEADFADWAHSLRSFSALGALRTSELERGLGRGACRSRGWRAALRVCLPDARGPARAWPRASMPVTSWRAHRTSS